MVATIWASWAEGGPADLIALRLDDIHNRPVASLDFALTHTMSPGNVRLVMIDGQIHKQDGELMQVDVDAFLDEAEAMMEQMRGGGSGLSGAP